MNADFDSSDPDMGYESLDVGTPSRELTRRTPSRTSSSRGLGYDVEMTGQTMKADYFKKKTPIEELIPFHDIITSAIPQPEELQPEPSTNDV